MGEKEVRLAFYRYVDEVAPLLAAPSVDGEIAEALRTLDDLTQRLWGIVDKGENENARVGAARTIADLTFRSLELRQNLGLLPRPISRVVEHAWMAEQILEIFARSIKSPLRRGGRDQAGLPRRDEGDTMSESPSRWRSQRRPLSDGPSRLAAELEARSHTASEQAPRHHLVCLRSSSGPNGSVTAKGNAYRFGAMPYLTEIAAVFADTSVPEAVLVKAVPGWWIRACSYV